MTICSKLWDFSLHEHKHEQRKLLWSTLPWQLTKVCMFNLRLPVHLHICMYVHVYVYVHVLVSQTGVGV